MRTATRRSLGAAGAAATAAALVATLAATPAGAAPNNNNSEKLRAAVTLEGVTRHLEALQQIAEANGGNRYAGLPGYEQSADYVAAQLRAAGYSPTFQSFEYFGFREAAPTQFSQVSPNAVTYTRGTDFSIMSYSGSGDVQAPLATPTGAQTGCAPADFTGFPAGTIALVSRGACTFGSKADNAFAAGAVGVVIYNNSAGLINGTLGNRPLTSGPVIGATQALGQALLASVREQTTVVRLTAQTEGGRLTTRNVLAELPGKDADNVVMVGAHLDSVAAGPGINDNGTGSAGILETAIQMAKTTPFNTVRFAWWSAEESGLVGSRHYVAQLPQAERDKIALYLNFDMIGSPNFGRFIYDGDNQDFATGPGNPSAVAPEGSAQIEYLFEDYFASQGLASEPTPFSGRSDYGPFIEVGIPSGGLFTGAEGIKTPAQVLKFGGEAGVAYDRCYHLACDTIANVDMVGFDQMVDAVAHAVITYAQNTAPVDGERGKGNFKQPATGTDAGGAGTGSGGGLHDEHDHEEPEAA